MPTDERKTHLHGDAVGVVVDNERLLQRAVEGGEILDVLAVDVPSAVPVDPLADRPLWVHLGDPLFLSRGKAAATVGCGTGSNNT